MEKKKAQRLTASEMRFAKEVTAMLKMSLAELLNVENTRMPVGI